MSQSQPIDLAITGGRVIDPSTGHDGQADIAIEGGRIVAIGSDLPLDGARATIDARGLLVVPGLIDMHAHVFSGMGVSIDPDLVGVRSGVTTIVDAGTAGPYTWQLFHEHVIARAITRTLAFLHIGRVGQAFTPEIRIEDDIDLNATIETARAHPDLILGIKLRAVGPGVTSLGSRMVELTRTAARESGGRQMIHIGDFDVSPDHPSLTRDVVMSLDAGDILAHVLTGQHGSLLDRRGRILPEVLEAQERGVVMEPSPGRGNFSFDTARALLDLGLLPNVIATDITTPGRGWLVYSLTEIMSRFMALGFTLHDVIRMTTSAPAAALGMSDTLGTLAPGRDADITLLREEQGRWVFHDVHGGSLTGERALAPVLTIRAGTAISPDWGPRPWGWLPESVDIAS